MASILSRRLRRVASAGAKSDDPNRPRHVPFRGVLLFAWRMSVSANRHPPSDHVRGHASPDMLMLTIGKRKMSAQTHLFRCLSDNFGVLIHDPATGATASIDAPEAGPVETALRTTGWKLTDILVTHHHADHTGGIAELKARHKCRVTAPRQEASRIPAVDATVGEGDTVKVGGLTARVLETPGHTAGHITYVFDQDRLAFVGDTLFSIGCGRVIEGTPEMMWDSLLKLRALPDDTDIFCGHEYTVANIRFA